MKHRLLLIALLLTLNSQLSILHSQPIHPDSVITLASRYIGTPYRWAGKTPKGFDCAGFVRFVYSHYGFDLAPSAGGQWRQGRRIADDSAAVGDLVFYGGRRHGRAVGHVGIVTEVNPNGTFLFIHSSTKRGVIITSSQEAYYRHRYIGLRRLDGVAYPEPQSHILSSPFSTPYPLRPSTPPAPLKPPF